jgi:hypothetical protein
LLSWLVSLEVECEKGTHSLASVSSIALLTDFLQIMVTRGEGAGKPAGTLVVLGMYIS